MENEERASMALGAWYVKILQDSQLFEYLAAKIYKPVGEEICPPEAKYCLWEGRFPPWMTLLQRSMRVHYPNIGFPCPWGSAVQIDLRHGSLHHCLQHKLNPT